MRTRDGVLCCGQETFFCSGFFFFFFALQSVNAWLISSPEFKKKKQQQITKTKHEKNIKLQNLEINLKHSLKTETFPLH